MGRRSGGKGRGKGRLPEPGPKPSGQQSPCMPRREEPSPSVHWGLSSEAQKSNTYALSTVKKTTTDNLKIYTKCSFYHFLFLFFF